MTNNTSLGQDMPTAQHTLAQARATALVALIACIAIGLVGCASTSGAA
ncbi:MAG: hypothetical protein SGJ09_02020 [Phycisphaerae bacterium]|nr:hypothetical protein [Phycisphaerae bacterium]